MRAIFDGKPKLIEVARTTLSLKSVETAIQKAFFLLNKPVSIKYIRFDGSTLDVQSTDHLLEAVKDAEAAGVQFFQLYAARKDPAEPLGFCQLFFNFFSFFLIFFLFFFFFGVKSSTEPSRKFITCGG